MILADWQVIIKALNHVLRTMTSRTLEHWVPQDAQQRLAHGPLEVDPEIELPDLRKIPVLKFVSWFNIHEPMIGEPRWSRP